MDTILTEQDIWRQPGYIDAAEQNTQIYNYTNPGYITPPLVASPFASPEDNSILTHIENPFNPRSRSIKDAPAAKQLERSANKKRNESMNDNQVELAGNTGGVIEGDEHVNLAAGTVGDAHLVHVSRYEYLEILGDAGPLHENMPNFYTKSAHTGGFARIHPTDRRFNTYLENRTVYMADPEYNPDNSTDSDELTSVRADRESSADDPGVGKLNNTNNLSGYAQDNFNNTKDGRTENDPKAKKNTDSAALEANSGDANSTGASRRGVRKTTPTTQENTIAPEVVVQ